MKTVKKSCVQRFYEQFERYFYMKKIVTMIPTDLVTNSLLSSFCFLTNQKYKSRFQQVGGLVPRNISAFCL